MAENRTAQHSRGLLSLQDLPFKVGFTERNLAVNGNVASCRDPQHRRFNRRTAFFFILINFDEPLFPSRSGSLRANRTIIPACAHVYRRSFGALAYLGLPTRKLPRPLSNLHWQSAVMKYLASYSGRLHPLW